MTTPIEEQLPDEFGKPDALSEQFNTYVAKLESALAAQTERADKLQAEIHDLCHDKHVAGPVTPEDFCKGCEEFQIKLFGTSPITRLTAELDAVRKERDELRKDVDLHRFFVPNAMIQNFQQYIHEVPACEIVAGGVLVSPDSLLKLANDLKNAMADAVNAACDQRDTAQARCAELERAIQEAPHETTCSFRDRAYRMVHGLSTQCDCWKSRISEQKPAQEQGKVTDPQCAYVNQRTGERCKNLRSILRKSLTDHLCDACRAQESE